MGIAMKALAGQQVDSDDVKAAIAACSYLANVNESRMHERSRAVASWRRRHSIAASWAPALTNCRRFSSDFTTQASGGSAEGRFGWCGGVGRSAIPWRPRCGCPGQGRACRSVSKSWSKAIASAGSATFPDGARHGAVGRRKPLDGAVRTDVFSSALVMRRAARCVMNSDERGSRAFRCPRWLSPHVDGYVDAGDTGLAGGGAHLRAVSRARSSIMKGGSSRNE